MEIPGENPKRFTYISNLFKHDPASVKLWTGWITWFKRKTPVLKNKEYDIEISYTDKIYTKYDLTSIIGTKGGDWEYNFLDELEEAEIIEKVGTRDGTDIFVFVRNWDKKLAKEVKQDEKWENELRPLSKAVWEKAEGKELF
jgi:hypothetical protein